MRSAGPVLVREIAVVHEVLFNDGDLQRVSARSLGSGDMHHVVVYPPLTGPVTIGDAILINTTAVQLSLGTGGNDFAICCGHAPETAEVPGHIMKLRYTPLQLPVLSCEAQESPHHEQMQGATDLQGTPVIAIELHSQLAAICHGVGRVAKRLARLAFVMTDQAALALPFSDLTRNLRHQGLLCGTVTCGQAFGGDLEAVNLFSGLIAAKEILHADVIVVGPGPGNVGTDTPYGFSAIDQGVALNAAYSLGGAPVMCLRAGTNDIRARHNGVSHHSLTIIKSVLLAPATIPIPNDFADTGLQHALDVAHSRHTLVTVEIENIWKTYLELYPTLKSMGRVPQLEPLLFQCALAAGAWSASNIK